LIRFTRRQNAASAKAAYPKTNPLHLRSRATQARGGCRNGPTLFATRASRSSHMAALLSRTLTVLPEIAVAIDPRRHGAVDEELYNRLGDDDRFGRGRGATRAKVTLGANVVGVRAMADSGCTHSGRGMGAPTRSSGSISRCQEQWGRRFGHYLMSRQPSNVGATSSAHLGRAVRDGGADLLPSTAPAYHRDAPGIWRPCHRGLGLSIRGDRGSPKPEIKFSTRRFQLVAGRGLERHAFARARSAPTC